jgi:hypothetical protein
MQSCDFTVGDGSTVACLLDEYCVVDCLGACRVDCTHVPACVVTCAEGEPATCDDGSLACGGGCGLSP